MQGITVRGTTRARLVAYLIDREGTPPELADRIVTATAEFLAVSAANPDARMTPSVLVDTGWHAFLMHPAAYTEFCASVGVLVDHVPEMGGHNPARQREQVIRTQSLIQSAGYTADDQVWADAATCSQCHAGCSDSP